MQTTLTIILCTVIVVVIGRQTINQSQCGVRQIKFNKVIVRGGETAAGDWPWHAAVFHKEGRSNSYQCGGTLISDHFVVTAEHCVIDENGYQMLPERIFVRLGLHVRHSFDRNSQHHEISTVFRYDGSSLGGVRRHDIALLKLNTVAEMTPYVQPACVNEVSNIAGLLGTAVGWGFTENDQLSEKLQSARLQIRTTDECIEANHEVFGPTWHSGVFCAGWNNGTSACNGDSGGGLFLQRNNSWYLSGITSFTEVRDDMGICNPTGYTAFTKISQYSSWIQNKTNVLFDGTQPDSSLLPSDCDVYNTNRILRGQKAYLFEFPWIARIEIERNGSKTYGIGTLISKRYVLSVRNQPKATKIQIILGEHTLHQEKDCNPYDATDCAPPIEEYAVNPEDVIYHKNDDGKSYKLTLYRLGRDVVFKDHIKPVCLPTTPALRRLSLPQYIVAGWGRDEHGNYHDDLRKATVRAVADNDCKAIYPTYKFTGKDFCAGGDANGSDTCHDGIPPIGYVVQHDAGLRFVQFGIVVGSSGACKHPTIYLKLANYVEWIKTNMKP